MKYSKDFNEACINPKIKIEPIDLTEEVIVTETVEVDGNYELVSSVKTIDPHDRVKGYKVSDFKLQNLIAVGATDLLRPISLSGSTLGVVDSTVSSAAGLENISID